MEKSFIICYYDTFSNLEKLLKILSAPNYSPMEICEVYFDKGDIEVCFIKSVILFPVSGIKFASLVATIIFKRAIFSKFITH